MFFQRLKYIAIFQFLTYITLYNSGKTRMDIMEVNNDNNNVKNR